MKTYAIGVQGAHVRRFATVLAAGMLALAGMAAPGMASASAPAAKVCRWYLVKTGDQMGELAERYGSSILEIQRANGLRRTTIYIGERLCIPVTVKAAPPSNPPQPASGPWTAEFWNNLDQSGLPVVRRTDSSLNNNWGFGSPDPARVFADNFSARWTRNIAFAAGLYRFSVHADDGFRLYVDGMLVLDQFGYEGEVSKSADVFVPAGTRPVRLDYVERSGVSLVKLDYVKIASEPVQPTPIPAQLTDWSVEYFNNVDLTGSPVRVARTKDINFNWGAGSPASNVQKDQFSARFVQTREFVGGDYRVVAQVDDGVRVYVDDQLVMNEWRQQSYRTFVSDFALSPGVHTIRVEYAEIADQAAVRVYLEKR
jgi:hypothetical protein